MLVLLRGSCSYFAVGPLELIQRKLTGVMEGLRARTIAAAGEAALSHRPWQKATAAGGGDDCGGGGDAGGGGGDGDGDGNGVQRAPSEPGSGGAQADGGGRAAAMAKVHGMEAPVAEMETTPP